MAPKYTSRKVAQDSYVFYLFISFFSNISERIHLCCNTTLLVAYYFPAVKEALIPEVEKLPLTLAGYCRREWRSWKTKNVLSLSLSFESAIQTLVVYDWYLLELVLFAAIQQELSMPTLPYGSLGT